MKKTQKEVVIDKLNLDGYVSNFWAIENYLLRLASVISELKKEGWEFQREYGEGSERKNFYYKVIKKPELKLFV